MTEPEKIAQAVVALLRDTPETRPLYDVKTFAESLSLSQRTVRDWIASGKVRSIKLGGAVRIPPEERDRLIAAAEAES